MGPPAAAFRRTPCGAAILAGVVACGLWAGPAFAQEPMRLNGTILQGTIADVQSDCSAGAANAVFEIIDAGGVSTFPYFGTFTEKGDRVVDTTPRTSGSAGSLPAADVPVLDAGSVCEEELENYRDAPVPRSSSNPYDTGR